MVKIGRGGALVTPAAQALLESATGLSPLAPQWAGIAGAEDGKAPPHGEGFWRKMIRAQPRVLVLFTDGLGDEGAMGKRGGVPLTECVIKIDASIVVAPQAAAAAVAASRALGKGLHDAIITVHEHLSEVDFDELGEEIIAAILAMWKFGAPLVVEYTTTVIAWITSATEFLAGVDYVGILQVLYEALKIAAEVGIEFAKQCGPPALAAAKAVAEMSEDLVAILSDVDWEAMATAAYALASQGALLAVESAKEAGKMIALAVEVAKEEGAEVADEVAEAAALMAEKGTPIAKAALFATAEFLQGAAEFLNDEALPALNEALGKLAGWGVDGATVLYKASNKAIKVAVEAGRELTQALARIDYGPLAEGATGVAALVVAAAAASAEAAKQFGEVMLPALSAAVEAGAEVSQDAIEACESLAEYAAPVAADAAEAVAGAMKDVIEHIADTDLEPLQEAAMTCAAAGMSGFELIAESLNAACIAAAAAGRAVAVLAIETIKDVPWGEISDDAAHIVADATEAASTAAKTGGALMLVGLKKAAAAGEEVSEAALAGATEMATTGAVLVGAAASEIGALMGRIIANLSDEACAALQKSIAVAAHVGKAGAVALWNAAVPAVHQAIELGREIAPYLIYALIPLALPAVAAYFLYKGVEWLAGKAYGELKKLPLEEMGEVAKYVAEGAAKASAEAAKQIAEGASVLADGTIIVAGVLVPILADAAGDAAAAIADVAGDAGTALADAAKAAAPHVVAAADAAARATAEAAKQAGGVLADGAEVIGEHAVEIAGDVGEFVETQAGNALAAGQDFWESGVMQDALGDAVDGAEDVFNESRAVLLTMFKTLSGISIAGCFSWLDHNQLAILLDYMQVSLEFYFKSRI